MYTDALDHARKKREPFSYKSLFPDAAESPHSLFIRKMTEAGYSRKKAFKTSLSIKLDAKREQILAITNCVTVHGRNPDDCIQAVLNG